MYDSEQEESEAALVLEPLPEKKNIAVGGSRMTIILSAALLICGRFKGKH